MIHTEVLSQLEEHRQQLEQQILELQKQGWLTRHSKFIDLQGTNRIASYLPDQLLITLQEIREWKKHTPP